MRNKITIVTLLSLLLQLTAVSCLAQNPSPPVLEYAFTITARCSPSYSCGRQHGSERVVVPITGGTVEGAGIRGEVVPGGADYQLVDSVSGRVEMEAIYNIRTIDGANIHVRNRGFLLRSGYFMASPTFEAPGGGPYSWLNDRVFVCRPEVVAGGVKLHMWSVR